MKDASFGQAVQVLKLMQDAQWDYVREGPIRTFLENWGTIRDLVMAMFEGEIDPGWLRRLLIKWRIVNQPFTVLEWPANSGCILNGLVGNIKQTQVQEEFNTWDFAACKPTIKPVAMPATYEVLLWQPGAGVSAHDIRTRMFEMQAFANVALFLFWLAQARTLDQFAHAHRLMTIPDDDQCYRPSPKSRKRFVPSFGPGGTANSNNDEPHFLRLEDPDELVARGMLGANTVFVAFREVSKQ